MSEYTAPGGGTPPAVDGANRLLVDLIDRAARQLGVVDTADRAARLLGVEQHGIADSVGAAGSVTAPAAGTVIAATPALPAGVYEVLVVTISTGSGDNQRANMQLQHGATVVASLPSIAGNQINALFRRVSVAGGETINVVNPLAGGAGCNYVASLQATRIA